MKILYHGSKDIIEKPILGKGKQSNDYGRGFYCTEIKDLAKEWAVDIDRDGYTNIYSIDNDQLSILNLNDSSYHFLNWLAILLENRQFSINYPLALEAKDYILNNFSVPYKEYDAIVGYRADDSYFSFAQDFLNGTISYRQLTQAMRLGNLGKQFVLKSEKAFNLIKFEGAEGVKHEEWYTLIINRDKMARRQYFSDRNKRIKGDIFITQIIDEEMKNNDLRLR